MVPRRLLIVLTGFAFLVGAAGQAMQPAKFMAPSCMDAAQIATGDCCAKMAVKAHGMRAPMKQVPCKGISLDCANQLGCISSQAFSADALKIYRLAREAVVDRNFSSRHPKDA